MELYNDALLSMAGSLRLPDSIVTALEGDANPLILEVVGEIGAHPFMIPNMLRLIKDPGYQDKPVLLMINSPGGSIMVSELIGGLCLRKRKTVALVTGECCSAALALMVRTTGKEDRFSFPEGTFMAHFAWNPSVCHGLGGVIDYDRGTIGELNRDQFLEACGMRFDTMLLMGKSFIKEQEKHMENPPPENVLRFNHAYSAQQALDMGWIGHILG